MTKEVPKYTALYPRMWAVPGPKCLHPKSQGHGRVVLYCCRLKNHEENHLHDVHPSQQA